MSDDGFRDLGLKPVLCSSRPTGKQWEVILRHMQGRTMGVDLGAGDGSTSMRLVDAGCTMLAIDRREAPDYVRDCGSIMWWHKTYEDVSAMLRFAPELFTDATAYLGYPAVGGTHGLVRVLSTFDRVVYLGDTFDNTMCGDAMLWAHLSRREVLGHVAHRRAQLIVYGPSESREDPFNRLPEELAGLDVKDVHSSPYEADPDYNRR